jgi:hypothetical protein
MKRNHQLTLGLNRPCNGQGWRNNRPPDNRVRVMLKLRPETDRLLYTAAGNAGLTKSEFVERAIRLQIASIP